MLDSVLGPMLYAILVSPLFDLSNLTNFADDNFIIVWNRFMSGLVVDLEKELEMIVKWLKDLGLQINIAKTEVCLFHHNNQPSILITIMDQQIRTRKSINALWVFFDSKLNWHEQVAKTIKKANRSLYPIKMIKRCFTPNEIKILLDSFLFEFILQLRNLAITNT